MDPHSVDLEEVSRQLSHMGAIRSAAQVKRVLDRITVDA
jgi:hypothetical protein